ncbi:MAG: PQQ-binding-like beta-propeller repeat protein [Gemmatimonadetes bacterium]|nr:PQQ-binding-like beta-propeller repeat protein [Gemmatimonadota bacterium]
MSVEGGASATSMPRHMMRGLVASSWAAQAAFVLAGVLSGTRFPTLRLAPWVSVVLVSLIYGAAIAATLFPRWLRTRAIRTLCHTVAAGVSARFVIPLLLLPPALNRAEAVSVEQLRRLSVAQEQHRLRFGTYATDVASVEGLSPAAASGDLRITIAGDSGWSARLTFDGVSCEISVRDLAWRRGGAVSDGVPRCARPIARRPQQAVHVLPRVGRDESPFTPADLRGSWPQHRADAERTGRAPGGEPGADDGPSWTTRVAGELRASAAIAGDQVIVGAHGNGELAAIHRVTGALGWRIRLPNWVHHEPVVGRDAIVATFGNNEYWQRSAGRPVSFGTPPGGVAAVERGTGVLRWIRYTEGSVMGAPVLFGESVITLGSRGKVSAWRLEDGGLLWESALDSITAAPMSNPLVADSLVVVSAEPARWCVFDARNGRRLLCRSVDGVVAGFGHSSPALHGGLLVQVGIGTPSGWRFKIARIAQRLLAFPLDPMSPPRGAAQDVVITGSEVENGDVRWKIVVSGTSRAVAGHIAGTPVFSDSSIYVPLPTIGVIVALDAATGRLRWRTEVEPARGSLTLLDGRVFVATTGGSILDLDAVSGRVLCRSGLMGVSDRAGLTTGAGAGILTLLDGTVISAPLGDWAQCRSPER